MTEAVLIRIKEAADTIARMAQVTGGGE